MFISVRKVFTPKRIVVLRVKGDGKINADTLDGDQQVRNIICQHLVPERVQFFVSCVDYFHNCRSWVSSFRRRVLAGGANEIPVTGAIGIAAVTLPDLHGDPADRIIVATALAHDATLLTADRQLLGWSGPLKRHDARR